MNKVIIACSNSINEATELLRISKIPLIKSVKREFSDNEMHVHLEKETTNTHAFIYQTMSPEPNNALIEVLLISDLLKKNNKITLIAPWFAYSRQDKQWFKTECFSLKTISGLLRKTGIKQVITFDAHFHRKKGTFKKHGITWINLTATQAILDHVKKYYDDFIIIGPDAGSKDLIKEIGGKVVFKKNKTCKTCLKKAQECTCTALKKEYEITNELIKPVKEKNVLIIDDIISSGGTILKAIEKLEGKNVIVAATHAFFNDESLEKLKNKTRLLITSNTVNNKTAIINVIPIINETITKI